MLGKGKVYRFDQGVIGNLTDSIRIVSRTTENRLTAIPLRLKQQSINALMGLPGRHRIRHRSHIVNWKRNKPVAYSGGYHFPT